MMIGRRISQEIFLKEPFADALGKNCSRVMEAQQYICAGPTHWEVWMGWWAGFSLYTGTSHRSTTNTLGIATCLQ